MRPILFVVCFLLANLMAAQVTRPLNAPASDTLPKGPSLVPAAQPNSDSVMVTLILRHQQNKNLLEIRRKLEANGFWDLFPPQEVRIVSWNIAMGLGHIIVLNCPASAVRKLNLAIENGAWGAYDTEIYLTYDYEPLYQDFLQKRKEQRE